MYLAQSFGGALGDRQGNAQGNSQAVKLLLLFSIFVEKLGPKYLSSTIIYIYNERWFTFHGLQISAVLPSPCPHPIHTNTYALFPQANHVSDIQEMEESLPALLLPQAGQTYIIGKSHTARERHLFSIKRASVRRLKGMTRQSDNSTQAVTNSVDGKALPCGGEITLLLNIQTCE